MYKVSSTDAIVKVKHNGVGLQYKVMAMVREWCIANEINATLIDIWKMYEGDENFYIHFTGIDCSAWRIDNDENRLFFQLRWCDRVWNETDIY